MKDIVTQLNQLLLQEVDGEANERFLLLVDHSNAMAGINNADEATQCRWATELFHNQLLAEGINLDPVGLETLRAARTLYQWFIDFKVHWLPLVSENLLPTHSLHVRSFNEV